MTWIKEDKSGNKQVWYSEDEYLQLKSENAELKAEIETLKKVKDFACINLNNYIVDNNKLKAENERIKEELDFLKNNTYRKHLKK